MASSRTSARSRRARPDVKGSRTPRIYTKPLRPLEPRTKTTEKRTLGYSVIDFATDILLMTLLPWQEWLLIHLLELRPNGRLRFRTAVILVARQNGKSTVSVVLALWAMYVFDTRTILGTAQDLDTAEEIWDNAVSLVEELDDDTDEPIRPDLKDLVKNVYRVNGKKSLELKTGQRYRVKAANRRAGRSFTADMVLLDELREHQSWDAWGAITKTTMARARALILALSNAGDATSVVLRTLRKLAHAALGDPDGFCAADEDDIPGAGGDADFESWEDEFDDDLAIFEWSAPPGCSRWDRKAWAQANPALGYTIDLATIASAARTDPDWVFRTEVLCQWVDRAASGPFPAGAWEATQDPTSRIAASSPRPVGLDVSWDRSTAHLGVAGRRKDGKPHIERIASRAGTDWVVGWFTDPTKPLRKTRPVVVQERGAPASGLIPALEEAGLTVVKVGGSDLPKACGEIYDHIRWAVDPPEGQAPPTLRHLDDPLLALAAANAATRPVGDAWAFDRTRSPVDVSPLMAVALALHALLTTPEPKKPPQPALVDRTGRRSSRRGGDRFDPMTASF